MHEVLVNGLGGLSLPRKSVVKLTDRPDMTSDVYRGRKTTTTTTGTKEQSDQGLHCLPFHLCDLDSFLHCKTGLLWLGVPIFQIFNVLSILPGSLLKHFTCKTTN